MAVINTPGNVLRHVRKTIQFDGTANNGALGDIIQVFTCQGVVGMERLTAYVGSGLTCNDGVDGGDTFLYIEDSDQNGSFMNSALVENFYTDAAWGPTFVSDSGEANFEAGLYRAGRGHIAFMQTRLGVTLRVIADSVGGDITGGD